MSRVLFDITPDPAGWTIFARERDRPAVFEEHQIAAFPREDAKEIANLLSIPVPTRRSSFR